MARLFVATELTDSVKDVLSRLQTGLKGAKWVSRENLHLTIRFLGEVSENEVEDIDAALRKVRCKPFSLEFHGLGVFSSGERVRSLWIGISSKVDIVYLKKRVDGTLFRVGVRPDVRRYVPHVTLARLRGRQQTLAHYFENVDPQTKVAIDVKALTLFSSYLRRNGAVYSPVSRYPLRGN